MRSPKNLFFPRCTFYYTANIERISLFTLLMLCIAAMRVFLTHSEQVNLISSAVWKNYQRPLILRSIYYGTQRVLVLVQKCLPAEVPLPPRKSKGSNHIKWLWASHWGHACSHSTNRGIGVNWDPNDIFNAHRLALARILWFDWLSSNGESVIGFRAIKQQSLGDR